MKNVYIFFQKINFIRFLLPNCADFFLHWSGNFCWKQLTPQEKTDFKHQLCIHLMKKSKQIAHRPVTAAAHKVRLSADVVQKSIHIYYYDVLSEIFFLLSFCLHIF